MNLFQFVFSNFARSKLRDLGDNVVTALFITEINREDEEWTQARREFFVSLTATKVFLAEVGILMDCLSSHLLRLKKWALEENTTGDDAYIIRVMEVIYENGLWISVHPNAVRDFCQAG